MTVKRVRDLVSNVKRAGLQLVGSVETTGGDHYNVRVKAPNGKEKDFTVAKTPSSYRSNKNHEAQIKAFARENAAPLNSLPAKKPVEEFKHVAKVARPKHLPLNIVPATLPPAPSPVLPAPAPQPFSSSPIMQNINHTLILKGSDSTKKKASAKTTNRLSQIQVLELADYLRDKYDWAEHKPRTYAEILVHAQKALSFTVTSANIAPLMQHYKLEFYTPPVSTPLEALSILAEHVIALCKVHNVPVGKDLLDLKIQ